MSYFWVNLGAHLLISLFLLLFFLWCVKNNQRNRWKKGFLFLLPFVTMIILLVQVGVLVVPRILDTTTVLRSTYRIADGEIEDVSRLKNYIVIDDETYYVNPFDFSFEVGDEVTVKYTPYAHYAYSLEAVKESESEEE
ncbi:MAG: hypothetical protein KBT07_04655 [Clostridiales bacterium]|nr:hypothetical protein [Candidatus Scatonaster coprocaballi]